MESEDIGARFYTVQLGKAMGMGMGIWGLLGSGGGGGNYYDYYDYGLEVPNSTYL